MRDSGRLEDQLTDWNVALLDANTFPLSKVVLGKMFTCQAKMIYVRKTRRAGAKPWDRRPGVIYRLLLILAESSKCNSLQMALTYPMRF